MNLVSAVILVVLAVIGAAEVVSFVSERLFGFGDSEITVFVVPVKKETANAEQLLRSVISKLNSGRFKCSYAVCLDCGADGKTLEICKRICEAHENIELISKKEFARKFEIGE